MVIAAGFKLTGLESFIDCIINCAIVIVRVLKTLFFQNFLHMLVADRFKFLGMGSLVNYFTNCATVIGQV